MTNKIENAAMQTQILVRMLAELTDEKIATMSRAKLVQAVKMLRDDYAENILKTMQNND